MEEHLIGGKDLPLVSIFVEILDDSNLVTSKCLSSPELSQHSNSVAKGLRGSSTEADLDEFLHGIKHDLLARVLGAQVDLEDVLASWSMINVDADREATDGVNVALVLQIVPIVNNSNFFCIRRSLNFKNVITNVNDSTLDVTPVSNKLGTDLHIQSKSISKVFILGQKQIALSVELEVFTGPGFEVWITITSWILRCWWILPSKFIYWFTARSTARS